VAFLVLRTGAARAGHIRTDLTNPRRVRRADRLLSWHWRQQITGDTRQGKGDERIERALILLGQSLQAGVQIAR